MDSEQAAYPPSPYAWYVLGALVLTTFLSYTDRQILSLLVDPLRRDLGISDTQIGLLIGTAFAFVYGIAGLPLGWLADRVCRRNLIAAGIALWSLGTVCCGLAQDFSQFFAARLLVGLGEAVLTPASISMISDSFPPSKRGAATSVFLMGIAMGAGGAIFFGGLALRLIDAGPFHRLALETAASWRLVLLLLGTLGLLPALLVISLREPRRHAGGAPEGIPPIGTRSSEKGPAASPTAAASTSRAAQWLSLAPLLLALGTSSLVDNAVISWTPAALIHRFHMPASEVGPLLGVLLMLGGGFGMLIGGLLSELARSRGYPGGRLPVAVCSAALTIPITFLLKSGSFHTALAGMTLYIFLSSLGEAVGMLAILERVA